MCPSHNRITYFFTRNHVIIIRDITNMYVANDYVAIVLRLLSLV